MKKEDIISIAEPVLAANGLFLVDLSVSKDNTIELLIDSMQGVNIQTCISVSKEIEQQLDRDAEDFELTVASAGIGYPFRVPQQFLKNIGKTVEVCLNDNTKITGELKAYSEESISIEHDEKKAVEGKRKKEVVRTEKTIPCREIKQIKDIIKF